MPDSEGLADRLDRAAAGEAAAVAERCSRARDWLAAFSFAACRWSRPGSRPQPTNPIGQEKIADSPCDGIAVDYEKMMRKNFFLDSHVRFGDNLLFQRKI